MLTTLQWILRFTRRLPNLVQFAGAFVIVGFAAWIQFKLTDITFRYPFLLFFAANAVNGALWKRWPALQGVILATFAVMFLIITPELALKFNNLAALAVFMTIGALEVLIIGSLVEGQVKLQQALLRARRAEAEQDLLFAEANHRMKNNLQIVSSFLTIQANDSDNPEVKEALKAAAARLYDTGQIHQVLSKSDGKAVDLDQFLSGICSHMASVAEGEQVNLSCRSNSNLTVPVHSATTVGLLTNELITNAIKHAYPEDAGGKIEVELACENGQCELSVEDDGVGKKSKRGGTGTKFISGLTAQLNGKLTYMSGKDGRGTRALVQFPTPKMPEETANASDG